VLNNGTTGTSATFQTQLFVDGQLRATWNTPPPLNSYYYSYVSDYSLGQLPAGSHTLRIRTDSSGAIAETSETDNEYSRTITVNGSLPNLTPYQPAAWSNIIVVSRTTGTSTDSSSLTTSDNLYLDWTVLNAGGSATTSTFQTQLLVDGAVRATWSTPPPLNASYYAYVADYPLGQLSAGSHTLTIRTDTTGAVAESNEGDNQYSRTINVTGAAPNLYPFQPSAWTNKIVVSRTAGTSTDSASLTTADNLYVDWAVLNGGGSATATTFQTQLFVDGTLRATWTTAAPLAVGYYSAS
jgi:subtilase family serine protease